MQKTRNTPTGRNKIRRSRGETFGSVQPAESGSATEDKPGPIFRPYFLNHTLTDKSGYFFYKTDANERYHKPKKYPRDKKIMAKYWIQCLKSHPKYQPVKMPANGDVDDALLALHNYTEKLFHGFSWSLVFPIHDDDGEPTLYYYRSLGCVGSRQIPMDWFSNSKQPFVRSSGLAMMKKLSENFGIPMIQNDVFFSAIEMAEDGMENDYEGSEELPYLLMRLKEQMYDDSNKSKSWFDILTHATNYMSYYHGKPKELQKELNEFATLTANQFEFDVHQVSTFNEELYLWLKQGRELADGPGFDIDHFNLLPQDFHHQNGDPVMIHHSIFFPYTFFDEAYGSYENWLEDIYQSIGSNDIYEFGHLTASQYIPHDPEKTKIFKRLLKFLDEGQALYHKLYRANKLI